MDTSAFEAALKANGFGDCEKKTVAPNVVNPVHTHPFAVRILVLSGEMTVTANGVAHTCRTGDTFAMEPGCEHFEQYGAEGTVYLVGRKHGAQG
jgi:quercetin dioxygenase-like cupin family protein